MEGRTYVEEAVLERTGGRTLSRAAKRSFDLVVALLALILLSPVFALIAIAIRLDTPGSVFFRQRRIGRFGEEFDMFKFRTMLNGAEAEKERLRHLNEAEGGLFKINGDPRVTRFGAFLRATSLDELPQLVNVVLGDMSLVGPRPLIAEEDALIGAPYRARREVRPGMTGPWQVAGASRVPLDQMAELDLEYTEEWSVPGDIWLIVRTVPHVVFRRGI